MNILDDLKWQYKSGGFEQKLIYWNIGFFLLALIFFNEAGVKDFIYQDWIYLSSDIHTLLVRPWTLIGYAFFHANFFHLLFNMIMLNFSGRLFTTFFTQKQFLGLYLLSAIFSGIAFIVCYAVLGEARPIVGASGAIMAILVAATTYSPLMNLRLLLIGNVKLWHVTAFFLILDMVYIFAENTGGHIAHLAGAFFGFAYIQLLKNGTDLSKGVFVIFDGLGNIGSRKNTPFKKVHKNYDKPTSKTPSKIVTKDKTQQQIDEILDKISRSGYESLTKEEKDFLFRAGKQQ